MRLSKKSFRGPALLVSCCAIWACAGSTSPGEPIDASIEADAAADAADGGGVVYDDCLRNSDCVIRPASCCGQCGAATRNDLVALHKDRVQAYQSDHCGDAFGCPACYTDQDARLVASCVDGKCKPVDLAVHGSTDCSVDQDCRIRTNACCECGGPTEVTNLIAIATAGEVSFSSLVCDPGQACPECAPVYPPEYLAVCSNEHCLALRSECNPACGTGRTCCGAECVNTANDPRHCGRCGQLCESGTYCNGAGQCAPPPCTTTCGVGSTCCADQCCGAGQLCCDTQGPISTVPSCVSPDERGTCPMGCAPLCICASPDTPIATPYGDRPIATLVPGELVYSVDRGVLVVVPILQAVRTPVSNHRVVRIGLSTGSVLELSAGHPTADGRRFGELREGDFLGGLAITSVATVPYAHEATHDILPASDTGAYFAAGVLLGSTLAPRR